MTNLLHTNDIREDDAEFVELKKLIKQKIGFNCEDYKQPHLKRRMAVRLRVTRSKSYKEYFDVLLRSPEEEKQLKETLTVNVTELFRNPEMFDSVKSNVLPVLLKSKGENRILKIWSAGCSNGEEACSIAIMLKEILGASFKRYSISILCTDIDEDSLAKAEKAVFIPKQLEKISKERLDRYFVKGENNYKINDELKNSLKVKKHDLISGPKMSGFDLIFCRNVTIYFEQKLQEVLYMDFYKSLNEGGFFVMGKTESLIGPALQMFKGFDLKERIYMKKEKS